MEKQTIEKILEAFDDRFKCINAKKLGCDSKGNIPVQVGEDEWEAEQCQYCFEVLFKQKDFLKTTLHSYAKQEREEERGRIKTMLEEFPAFTCCSDKCMGQVADEAKKPAYGTNYLQREKVLQTIKRFKSPPNKLIN